MVKDGIGGTIKNKLFQKVKSGRIVADNQEDFALHAYNLIQSIATLYLPKKDIFEEPVGIYIKGTQLFKVKKKRND